MYFSMKNAVCPVCNETVLFLRQDQNLPNINFPEPFDICFIQLVDFVPTLAGAQFARGNVSPAVTGFYRMSTCRGNKLRFGSRRSGGGVGVRGASRRDIQWHLSHGLRRVMGGVDLAVIRHHVEAGHHNHPGEISFRQPRNSNYPFLVGSRFSIAAFDVTGCNPLTSDSLRRRSGIMLYSKSLS